MPYGTKHLVGHLSELSELRSDISTPLHSNSGGFLLCLSGETQIVIDSKQYKIKKLDLIVAFPYSIIQISKSSPDFDCIIMGADADFFYNAQISNRGEYFTSIRENPSISLNENEAQKLLWFKDVMTSEQKNNSHLFRKEIDEAFSTIILYEIAAIYSRREPNSEQPRSRDEIIFNDFIFELFNNNKEHRGLEYYAMQQQITSSHLSRVVKRVSSRSASEWIINYTIENIKKSLLDTTRSISDISDEYHFANSSFFAQYFKKYTKLTPREFREINKA